MSEKDENTHVNCYGIIEEVNNTTVIGFNFGGRTDNVRQMNREMLYKVGW